MTRAELEEEIERILNIDGSTLMKALDSARQINKRNDILAAVDKYVLELLEDDEEPDFVHGEATYGDSIHDHEDVIYGRNQLRAELRNKVLGGKE